MDAHIASIFYAIAVLASVCGLLLIFLFFLVLFVRSQASPFAKYSPPQKTNRTTFQRFRDAGRNLVRDGWFHKTLTRLFGHDPEFVVQLLLADLNHFSSFKNLIRLDKQSLVSVVRAVPALFPELDSDIRNDRHLALVAVQWRSENLTFVSSELLCDELFVQDVVRLNPQAFSKLPFHYRLSKSHVVQAIKGYWPNIRYIDASFFLDLDIALLAIDSENDTTTSFSRCETFDFISDNLKANSVVQQRANQSIERKTRDYDLSRR